MTKSASSTPISTISHNEPKFATENEKCGASLTNKASIAKAASSVKPASTSNPQISKLSGRVTQMSAMKCQAAAPTSKHDSRVGAIDDLHRLQRLISRKKLSNGARLEFVSIDLEFTGLVFTLKDQDKMTRQEYFSNIIKGAKNFGVVQLGVCLAGRKEGDSLWYVEPFNFFLFPRRRRLCVIDTTSISFLQGNGFQFDHWIKTGLDFEAIHDIEYDKKHQSTTQETNIPDIQAIERDGAQIILKAIMESGLPLVLHNGMLDLLHLIDKFLASVGRLDEKRFCNRVLANFPGGIYDTKYMARNFQQQCGFGISNIAGGTGFGLNSMVQQFLNGENPEGVRREDIAVIGSLAPRYTGSTTHEHEAGYDALLTAQVFICELHHLLHSPTFMSRLAHMASSFIQAASTMVPFHNQRIDPTYDGCIRCLNDEICSNWENFTSDKGIVNVLDLYVSPWRFDIQEVSDAPDEAIAIATHRKNTSVGLSTAHCNEEVITLDSSQRRRQKRGREDLSSTAAPASRTAGAEEVLTPKRSKTATQKTFRKFQWTANSASAE